jgi:hypothetical protein
MRGDRTRWLYAYASERHKHKTIPKVTRGLGDELGQMESLGRAREAGPTITAPKCSLY